MAEPMFKVIERGPYGSVRELLNPDTSPPLPVFTWEQAEAMVAEREVTVVRRYRYEIVET
jgi:hypothetical protein